MPNHIPPGQNVPVGATPMLLDNKSHGKVSDVLAESLSKDSSLAVITRLFSIYGYMALQSELSRLKQLRLVVPMTESVDGDFAIPGLSGGELDRQLRNWLDMAKVARACHDWLDKKADIRSVKLPVSQGLFHASNPDGKSMAISGSSSLDSVGLGAYNPDWAVLVEDEGQERLYFVVETKGGLFADAQRPTEKAKIDCGREHFKAIGTDVEFCVENKFNTFAERFSR